MAKLVIGTDKTSATPAVVIEKGIVPTGTLSITQNGMYDVTQYASANVNTPAAPAHCIEKSVVNGVLSPSNTIINLIGVYDIGANALRSAYENASGISGAISLGDVNKLSYDNSCANMFKGCTGIVSADLSKITQITGQYSANGMFSGCSGLTSINMSSLTELTGNYCANNMFLGCYSLASVNLPALTHINGTQTCVSMFQDCSSLISADLSALVLVGPNGGQPTNGMFLNCSRLTNVNLSSLTEISVQYGLYRTFNTCPALTTMVFDSLKKINGNQALTYCFQQCSNLSSLSFPAINNSSFSSSNVFSNMCQGVTNVTIHFPSNTQATVAALSGYSSIFGATNGQVLFDLPATVVLTGGDTVSYERNPKYDSATSLSWRVLDSAVTTTPYYTSGTTDPAVGDTIYSDPACTTAVTTISAIA